MSNVFEPMSVTDLAEVTALEETIQAFPWTMGNFRDSLLSGYECWLWREAGDVASFAVAMQAVDEMHLLDIGVAPAQQRQGHGRALLDFLCDRARRAGLGRMLLEVRPSNVTAVAFYQCHDFAEIGRRRGYYPTLMGREDAIVMARQL